MPPITTEDVVCYLLGQSSPAMSHEITKQAASDEEFAAQLGLLRACILPSGDGRDSYSKQTPPLALKPPAPRRFIVRWAAIVLATIFSMGMAWAGWEFIREKPLLEDHFTENWGDREIWSTPRRVVMVEGGHVRLFDRGSLCTRAEFTTPYKLSFRWRWNDLAGDFLYRDILTVVLRTSGKHKKEHAFEILDGIIIFINATSGEVSIRNAKDNPADINPSRVLKLAPQVWYDITILDHGDRIEVFMAGDHLPQSEQPVKTFNVDTQFEHGHIAFYNRERVASASFESWLDDVVITRLKK